MLYLPITRSTLPLNLALEESLLERAEEAADSAHEGAPEQRLDEDEDTIHEYLRLWESPVDAVVLGRASSVSREVHVERCRSASIPIVRRCSGGASVVIGPGCLMYAVMLDLRKRPALRALDVVHRFVMERIQQACRTLHIDAQFQGTCDLTIDNRKFSGNSLRCKRNHSLYHGTLLYDFDLAKIPWLLKEPPRQPEYRASRHHESFVANLVGRDGAITGEQLRRAMQASWNVEESIVFESDEHETSLAASRYATAEWTYKIA